jgi:hypothetical protein
MTVLILLEAPLASVFATSFLGQAVFLDRPKLRTVFWEVLKLLPRIAWCQVIVRGTGVVWLVLLMTERFGEVDGFLEIFVPIMLMMYVSALRAFRPFLNEIVLLERNPLLRRRPNVITIGRRSSMLHTAASGELTARWMGATMIGTLLALSFYGTMLFVSGVLLNDWSQGPIMLQVAWPVAMWMAATYLTVVRFLSYLDLRIRQEGWEVELRMRAEAARTAARLTP